MASSYWPLAVIAAVFAALSYGIPLLLDEVFPWKSLWKQRYGRPVPTTKSYKGRTALITGANGAFGSRSAKIFAHREIGTLILADVRDCGALKKEIEDELAAAGKPKPNIIVWQVDLMTFKGCQALADKAKDLKTLDHVLMTVGILSFDPKESPEGWETSLQVNYFSNALISLLLLAKLKASPSNPNPPVLTFITSFGVWPASPTMGVPSKGAYLRALSNKKPGMAQGHQYGRSKALLLYWQRELSARVAKTNAFGQVTINSADPGSSWTPLTNPNQQLLIPRLIMNISARDPQIGATALTNGVSCGPEGHGKIMQDFDTSAFPPFMLRKSGQKAQQQVWNETRAEFEAKVPEVKKVFEMLDGK